MALQTKLSRSPIHKLMDGVSITTPDVTSTDHIAVQRMADETVQVVVKLSNDPGAPAGANACLVVEGRADDGSAAWVDLARVQLTNAVVANGGRSPTRVVGTGSVVFYGPQWGISFQCRAMPQMRVAFRAVGGAYGTLNAVTAEVWIVE